MCPKCFGCSRITSSRTGYCRSCSKERKDLLAWIVKARIPAHYRRDCSGYGIVGLRDYKVKMERMIKAVKDKRCKF